MFTGIVAGTARLLKIEDLAERAKRLTVLLPAHKFVSNGASVALNGCCLSIVKFDLNDEQCIAIFDCSNETLSRTNLNHLKSDALINFEFPVSLADPLGGHLVSGHIDVVGTICEWIVEGAFIKMSVSLTKNTVMAPLLVEKGSVAVDGVSLTVNEVKDLQDELRFSCTLIPETLMRTNFKNYRIGTFVNVEGDLMAKYALRALQCLKREQESVC